MGCYNYNCKGTYDNELKMIVYEKVDKMPFYKNGTGDFLMTLAEKVTPKDSIRTTINLEFTVLPNGKVSNLHLYKENNVRLNINEVLLKSMKIDDWTPGECDGEKVAVKMNFPLRLDWQE